MSGKNRFRLSKKIEQFPDDHPHAMTPERRARHKEAAKHPDKNDLRKAQKLFAEVVSHFD